MNIQRSLKTFSALMGLICIAASGPRPRAAAPAPVSLDVPGRSDSTPWVAASGAFVAVAWGAALDGRADVFLAVSRDGAATFGAPVRVNSVPGEARLGGELPPRVALSRRSGQPVPDIAVLWTARAKTTEVKLARSTDGGKTFTAPVNLQSGGAAGDRGWPALAAGPQGDVHAIWLDHRGLAAKDGAGTGHAAHKGSGAHDGVAMAQKSSLYYASPTAKPSREREVTNGVCYCCKTALAAGPNGSLYAAWRHVYPGNLRDIAFAISRDAGRSFSQPVRVSEDEWAIDGCPDDGPAMAVDTSGTVHLAWPTLVTGPEPEGAIFYASTRDGIRFSRRVRVPTLGGPKPSHPQIVVSDAGRVFVAWDETVRGQRVSAMREVRPRAGAEPTFGGIVTLAESGPAVYPVIAATNNGLVAVWTTGGEQSRVQVRAIRNSD